MAFGPVDLSSSYGTPPPPQTSQGPSQPTQLGSISFQALVLAAWAISILNLRRKP